MGDHERQLIAELNHRINSPLAAIRNALYLASQHTGDPRIQHYLQLADDEVEAIAAALREARKQEGTPSPLVLHARFGRAA